MSIQLTLNPEHAQRHAENILAATPGVMELARLLQVAAFLENPERRMAVNTTLWPADWMPAPLYLSQALALTRDKHLRDEVAVRLNIEGGA